MLRYIAGIAYGFQNNGLVENTGRHSTGLNPTPQVTNSAQEDPVHEVLNSKIFQVILKYLPVKDLDQIQYTSYRFYQATQAQIPLRINVGTIIIGSWVFTSNVVSHPKSTYNVPNNSRIAKFADRLNQALERIEHISVQLPSIYGDEHKVDKTLLGNIFTLFKKKAISGNEIENLFLARVQELFKKLPILKSVEVIESVNDRKKTFVKFADCCLIPNRRWRIKEFRTLISSSLVDYRLTKLNLSYNHKINISDFAHLSNLQELNISHCKEVANRGELKKLENLVKLEMVHIDGGPDFGFLSSLVKLTYLNMSKNEVTSLAFLSELKCITHLVLDDCPIRNTGMNYVAKVATLVMLSVANCKITSCTEKFAFRENIRSLNVSENCLLSDMIKKISCMTFLTELFVNGCDLVNRDLDTLLSHYPNLKRLRIEVGSKYLTHYDGIDASGFETIAKIKTLEYLFIESPQQYRRSIDHRQAVKDLMNELKQLKIFMISPVIVFKYFETTTEPSIYACELANYKQDRRYGEKPFIPKFIQDL